MTPGQAKLWRVVLLLALAVIGARPGCAAGWTDDFSSAPLARGWRTFGETSLFAWNATNQTLEVTWDSSKTNSYIYRSLGTVLGKSDDFSFSFDLRLRDLAVGITPGKTSTFEIALGLVQWHSATNTNFFRGAGVGTYGPRNLVEFDYFPAAGAITATFAPTVVSTNNQIAYSHNFPLELSVGDLFRIELTYTASNQTLRTTATRNGLPFGLAPTNSLKELVLTNQADFRVDGFAVCSYSDARQSPPQFAGSVLAHGVLDNIVIVTPEPPVTRLAGDFNGPFWQAEFQTRTNWLYFLERTTNWALWNTVSTQATGSGRALSLQETNPAGASSAFYRIRAERP